jgi:hypothetical protein
MEENRIIKIVAAIGVGALAIGLLYYFLSKSEGEI